MLVAIHNEKARGKAYFYGIKKKKKKDFIILSIL